MRVTSIITTHRMWPSVLRVTSVRINKVVPLYPGEASAPLRRGPLFLPLFTNSVEGVFSEVQRPVMGCTLRQGGAPGYAWRHCQGPDG